MRYLLDLVRKNLVVSMIILLISLIGLTSVQRLRLGQYQKEITGLNEDISSLRQAAKLVETLYQERERLTQEREQLLQEIRNEDGYAAPLPDGIRQRLERLR